MLAFISLACFVLLLAWQLVVLITGCYPDHLLPAVKVLSGSQESIPVAYSWTIRLAGITVAGFLVSLIGLIVVSLRIKNLKANKSRHRTGDNVPL